MLGGWQSAKACWAAAVLLGSAMADSRPIKVLDDSAELCPAPLLRSASATSAETATRAASCTCQAFQTPSIMQRHQILLSSPAAAAFAQVQA